MTKYNDSLDVDPTQPSPIATPRTCKQCHFLLIPKIAADDQAALMHGFCTAVCRKLYEQDKDLALKHANDPIHMRGYHVS